MTSSCSSNITSHSMQRDMVAEMRSNSAETRDLLLAILSSQSERQQVVDMQRQGQHIAEQVMAAGQEVVHLVFLSEYISDLRSFNNSNYNFSVRQALTVMRR